MEASDPRLEMLARWDRAAAGWGRRADQVRDRAMPISAWLIDQLALQPGERVLELAAGPGDTGFLAAELVQPGGTLVSSDASESMLELARRRARDRAIDNVEFRRFELEWIDLEAASVDAILCRWALMLLVDPLASLKEMRRVLKPGGRAALAVWDLPEHNAWVTIPNRALIELGHAQPPDPDAPGMFALAAPGQLAEMLAEAGFVEIVVESIELDRSYVSVQSYVEETLDLSLPFAELWAALEQDERSALEDKIASLAAPYTAGDELRLPGRSLAAAAHA